MIGFLIYMAVVVVAAGIWTLLIEKNGTGDPDSAEGKHWP